MGSRDQPGPEIDPDGVDPLVGPGTGRDELDDATALAAAPLFDSVETPRWMRWMQDHTDLRAGWSPTDDTRALIDLWAVVLRQIERGGFTPCDWATIAADPPVPLWLRLNPRWAGPAEHGLGLTGSRMAAGVMACTCAWMQQHWGGGWFPVPAFSDHPAATGFSVPDGLGFTEAQIPSGLYSAVRGQPHAVDPEKMLHWVMRHAPGTKDPVRHEDTRVYDLTEYDDDPRWALSFDDVTAHLEEARVERLVELLKGQRALRGCIHEDRELVLFDSDLDRAALETLVDGLWSLT
jgi:hypothetical protein